MHRFREQEDETLASRVAPRVRAEETTGTGEETTVQVPQRVGPKPVRGFWNALRAENPVLVKELKSLYGQAKSTPQQRKASRILNVGAVTGLYLAALLGMREILKNVDPTQHTFAWFVAFAILLGLQGFIVLVSSLSRLPSSIAKEREKQTWNALLLSRLSPETILSGKYVAGLSSALTPVALFLPLSLLAGVLGNVNPLRGLLAYAVVIATAAMLSMTSLFSSWKHATTAKATNDAGSWMGALVFGAAGVWGIGFGAISLIQYLVYGRTGEPIDPIVSGFLGMFLWFNPLVALFCTVIQPGGMPPNWNAQMLWMLPLVFLAFSSTLTVSLWRKMVAKFWDAPRDFSG